MAIVGELRAGLRPLVNLVYPPRCPACGAQLAEHGGLCVDCWGKLERTADETYTAGEDGASAGAQIIAPFVYNDISRDLVLGLKHGGKVSLASLMGQMMAAKLDVADADAKPLLVPVPLHWMRLWKRGYNQAALLGQEIAKAGKGELCVDVLERQRRTPSLGGLNKAQRRKALKGAIAVRQFQAAKVRGRDILLVDDVYTSGATSSACVDALIEGGAKSVRIACFARVMNP